MQPTVTKMTAMLQQLRRKQTVNHTPLATEAQFRSGPILEIPLQFGGLFSALFRHLVLAFFP